ncbi:MAG: hypothetical protein EZS28_018507 [Streblomastix strix]|uniref:Uncharacterized protein n=1 Tax=Streblomastix strix TaxID=222440 RepID=A0A5J4VUW2_9EUKA|nr:MAG: hypothetical protein EZS28_018507 [Streblomastix strix]
MQLCAKNLDNIIEATDEFEQSLTTPRGNVTRRYNPTYDYTLFFITQQCERNSNGPLIFDGTDTQNYNASIELKGLPIFRGAPDIYCKVNSNEKHQSPPILYIFQEIFGNLAQSVDDLAITIQHIHMMKLLDNQRLRND